MKLPPPLHRWNLAPKRALALQRDLAARIVEVPLAELPRLIAGGDAAFTDNGKTIIAGWVVWDRLDRRVAEQCVVRRPVRFPYIPGLLSFREAPALLAAARRLEFEPDLFMLDGHGRAHPRRFGIACHVGLWLSRPTLGVAKSRLCGEAPELATVRGSVAELRDRNEVIGMVLRTADAVRPIFVSAGHLLTLEDAVRVALECAGAARLPEPTRLADQLVRRTKTAG